MHNGSSSASTNRASLTTVTSPTDTAAEADGTPDIATTGARTAACEIHGLRANSSITLPHALDTSGDASSIPGVPGTHDTASTESVITVAGTNDSEHTDNADIGSVGASLSTEVGETDPDDAEDKSGE